ncbi:hypothetical protein [Paenibacillus larvae]|uniref:Uncharacterized protein n=1 Tax=Paenibacillus larvae subsp. larvae TaxID=147375 RepID=A0A6C0QRL3_9BACL|nr:hypothetical protein [Paenibacillus larvae]QHZ51141.1 hypothetical protein ERICV_01993 [Paenibacillus larvae subsp. larvae]
MEIAKLVLNRNGKFAIEFSSNQEVLNVLAPVITQIFSNQQFVDTSKLRAIKRGTVPKTDNIQLRLAQPKTPQLRLTPRQERELETLWLDIRSAVEYFWKLCRTNRKQESKSRVYKELFDEFEEVTGYRARRKTTLGRVDPRSLVLNTLIREGKGPEFLSFVRSKARIFNSELIRI